MTRVLAFSDLHHRSDLADAILTSAATADLVIGAGDFCNMRHGLVEVMDWFKPIAHKSIFVAGNAESVEELRAATRATVLHGTGVTLAGLSIFGLGYAVPVTPFGAWSCDLTEHAAENLLAALETVNILVTHSPPKGLADQTSRGVSVGSNAIRNAISLRQPRFAFCGHIHDSWGVRGQIGRTEVVNLGPHPVIFDI